MGTETTKIALNAHVHLRTENQHMSRPERHVDDITDMRRSSRLRENTSGWRPLGSSSRLLNIRSLLTMMTNPEFSWKQWKKEFIILIKREATGDFKEWIIL